MKAQELRVSVAKKHQKVFEDPAPWALFEGFYDSALEFVVCFRTSDYGNWIFIARIGDGGQGPSAARGQHGLGLVMSMLVAIQSMITGEFGLLCLMRLSRRRRRYELMREC